MALFIGIVLVTCLSGAMATQFVFHAGILVPQPDCSLSSAFVVLSCTNYLMESLNTTAIHMVDRVMNNQRAIRETLMTGDTVTAKNYMNMMCLWTYNYMQCLRSALQCNSDTLIQTSTNQLLAAMPQHPNCDGGTTKASISNELDGSNADVCLATADGMHIKTKLQKMTEKLKTVVDRLKSSLTPSNLLTLCQTYRGAMNELKYLFRKYRNANCNVNTKRLLTESLVMDKITGLDSVCQLPDVRQSDSFNNKANRRDIKRVTVGIFGSSHMKVYNRANSGWITCLNHDNGTNIDLINHDNLQISGVVDTVSGSSGGPTYLKSLKIKFRDSNLDDLESITMNAGDTNVFQEKMDSNRSEIEAGTTSNGGGRIMGKLKMTKRGNKQLDIRDENSGGFIKVRKYLVNNTIPFYSVIARLPDSMLSDGFGSLMEGCSKSAVTTTYFNGRRRRATVSEAGTFDVAATGDPNADQMATEANSDADTISVYDSLMSAGHVNAKITNLLLTAGLLFTLSKLITG